MTAQGSNAAVEVRDLFKRYRRRGRPEVTAVDGITMTVHRGEVYGLLGPNGAGKTTTLRMLLGLIAPSAGRVSVLGRAPGDPRTLARVGALIEDPAFYPYLSGRDNLKVLARYAAIPEARVDEALRAVDLAGRGKDRFSTYSLGMKQRLGVAAALLKDPDLIVLDEPTNGLDPAGMRDMRSLVIELSATGRTVVLSSHLLGEVQHVCDRVGVMDGGRVVAEGTVDQLLGDAELVVTAAPSDVARARLEEMPAVERVRVVDGSFRVQVDRRHIGDVNKNLVTAGVSVTELRQADRRLEDVFFEMTGHQAPSTVTAVTTPADAPEVDTHV